MKWSVLEQLYEEMNDTDLFNKLKDLLTVQSTVRNESQYEYNHRLWLAKNIVEMKKAEGLEIIRAYQKQQQVLEECQELIKKGRELNNFLWSLENLWGSRLNYVGLVMCLYWMAWNCYHTVRLPFQTHQTLYWS